MGAGLSYVLCVILLSDGMPILSFSESDILHVDAAGQSMVILNSYDAALDLLERRSSVYSSRFVSGDEWVESR